MGVRMPFIRTRFEPFIVNNCKQYQEFEMHSCKITALKTQDPNGANRQFGQTICPRFTEGQEFIVKNHPVEDFCDWAWKDIHKAYSALMNGKTYPGAQDEDTIIIRCRDIIRPIYFRLERIND